MKTKEAEVYYYKSIDSGAERISDHDMSTGIFSDEYILLGKGNATIELVDQDERILAADKLEEKRKRVIADHVVEIEVIDAQIQELRSLTHQES